MLNLKLTQLLEEKKQKYFQAGEQLTIAPLALQGTPANNRKSCCSAAMWVDFTHFMLNDKRQTLDAGACLSGGGGSRLAHAKPWVQCPAPEEGKEKVRFLSVAYSCTPK